MTADIPQALADTANKRDILTTAEFAFALNKAPQTVRKNYCQTGECYGIRPVKIGNSLNWSVTKTAELINRGTK